MWQNSGVVWERETSGPEPDADAAAGDTPASAFPFPAPPAGDGDRLPPPPAPAGAQPFPVPPAPAEAQAFPVPPAAAAGPPSSMPLSAPTLAESARRSLAGPPAPDGPDVTPWRVRPRPPEPDELFRAWQGSVRQASSGPAMTARRRRQAWRLLRAGVPVAVIVAVGVGALIMLTGKPGAVLADGTKGGGLAVTPHSGAAVHHAPAPPAATAFPGYPGQRGTVMVSSMASAAGIRLAVGGADGHPAIWRHAAGGSWALVSAGSPAVYRRAGVQLLTSVAHGPSGWIAVGGVVSGVVQQPVVVTSANGVTWHALDNLSVFAGKDSYVAAVTAGPAGYVVVGKHVAGRRTFAALWWSTDLRHWFRGENGGLNGGIEPSAENAVTAVRTGFVAVGTHGAGGGIWTSANGRRWSVHDIRLPAGATSARLTQVAANGSRVVAAGYAVTRAGDIPVVVVSADGGRQWHQVVLAAPGRLGEVMALTAAGPGFVAAGQAGPAGAQRAVAWSSATGLSWQAATPAGPAGPADSGARQITALLAADGTVTGTARQGATSTVVTLSAP